VQSVPAVHFFPSAHAGQLPPPQSTSVSVPSSIPSLHVGAGASHLPAVQSFDWQSSAPLHGPPFGHGVVRRPQLAPPSTTKMPPLSELDCIMVASVVVSPSTPPSSVPLLAMSLLLEHAATHPMNAAHDNPSRQARPIVRNYLDRRTPTTRLEG
jgi:hypothetical protein